MSRIEHQTLALAGMLQACCQVNDIATRGLTRQEASIASLKSILTTSANDVDDALGQSTRDHTELRYGLTALADLFSGNTDYINGIKYAMSISQLQNNFRKNTKAMTSVATDLAVISHTVSNADDRDEPDAILKPEIVSQFASIWTQHIRKLDPQIVVQGKPIYLKNDDNIQLIRALLLAGLRCSWLWRQLGGRNWHLLFKRSQLRNTAQKLLQA